MTTESVEHEAIHFIVATPLAGTSQYMYVEFVTSPAGPLLNTGFHFNVGNWPGHVETAGIKHGVCDWLLSSDSLKDSSASEGIFLSIAHWYPPNTSCSYHIKGHPGEIVRLYFPRLVNSYFMSPLKYFQCMMSSQVSKNIPYTNYL